MYRQSNNKPRYEQTKAERTAQRQYKRKFRKAFEKTPNKYKKHRPYTQSKSEDIEENLPNLPSVKNSYVNYVDSIEHFQQEKTIEKLRQKYKIHKGHNEPATDSEKKLPSYQYHGNNALNKDKRKAYDRFAHKNGLPLLIDKQESMLRARMEGNSDIQIFRGSAYVSEQELYMSTQEITTLRKDDRKNSKRLGKKFNTRKKLRKKMLAEREQQAKQIRQQRRDQFSQLNALNRLKRKENRDDIKELLKLHEETKALEKRVKHELKQEVTKEDLLAHQETEKAIEYLKVRNDELRIHALDNERGAEEVNDEVSNLSSSIEDIYELEQEKQEHLQQMLDGEKAQIKAEKDKFDNLQNSVTEKLKGLREMVAYKKSLKEKIKKINEENNHLRGVDHKRKFDELHDKSTNVMPRNATIQQFVDELLVEQEFENAYHADDELSSTVAKDDNSAITRQNNLIADEDFTSANPQIADDDMMIERRDNLTADKDFVATTTNVITTLSDDDQLEKFDDAIKAIKPLSGNETSDELKQRNKELKSLDNKMSQFAKKQEIICDKLARELDQKKTDRDVLKNHHKKMDESFSKLSNRVTKRRDAQELREVSRECDNQRRALLHKLSNKKSIINDEKFINKVMARPSIKSSGNFLQRWKNYSHYLDTAKDTTDRYNSKKDGLQRIEAYIKHKKRLFGGHRVRKLVRTLVHASFFDSTSSESTVDTDALRSSDKKYNTYEEPKYYWAKTFRAKLEEQLKEHLGVDHDNANDLIDKKVNPKSYRQAVADAYDASLKDPKMVQRLQDYGCSAKEFGQILVDGKESYQLVQDMDIPQLAGLKPSQGSDNIVSDQQDISSMPRFSH